MKKLLTILLLIFISFCNSYSQSYSPEWSAKFNSSESAFDFPTQMAVDSSGNVYVTGKSWGNGTEYDYSTVKYNSAGVFLWEARYNGPGNYTDEPTAIAVDKFGNVFVTGYSFGGSSEYDYATIKYNSNGIQQWVDRYNGTADSTDKANSIAIDGLGNIFITGESTKLGGVNSNNFDCVTIKYNSTGVRLWTRSYELQAGSEDYGKFIKIDLSGNVYVVGYIYSSLLSIKYNNTGTLQWVVQEFATINLRSVALDILGNLYIACHMDSSLTVKYNSSGIRQWISKSYDFVPRSITIDSSGNLYLTGSRGSFVGKDIITLKYNSSGIQQWYEIYSAPGYIEDEAVSLSLDISGNIYVTGYSYYPSTVQDYITIKYNSSGIKQWVSRFNYGTTATEEKPQAIGIDYSGNVFVTGYTIGLYTEYDYLTIKYPNSLQLNANILIEGFYNENNNRLNTKDTITAYIRNTVFPFAVIDSGKAIVDTNTFRCGFCFNHATAGTYYITLKHRNSLETWSKQGGEVFAKSKPTYYDFTSVSTNAYGNNLTLVGSKYCLFSGDLNHDGYIDLFDLVPVYNDASDFLAGRYLPADLNGDSIVDLTDITICYNNSINFVRVIQP